MGSDTEDRFKVSNVNADGYHGESWAKIGINASWKTMFRGLVLAVLAIDTRLAEISAQQRMTNNLLDVKNVMAGSRNDQIALLAGLENDRNNLIREDQARFTSIQGESQES